MKRKMEAHTNFVMNGVRTILINLKQSNPDLVIDANILASFQSQVHFESDSAFTVDMNPHEVAGHETQIMDSNDKENASCFYENRSIKENIQQEPRNIIKAAHELEKSLKMGTSGMKFGKSEPTNLKSFRSNTVGKKPAKHQGECSDKMLENIRIESARMILGDLTSKSAKSTSALESYCSQHMRTSSRKMI